MKQTLIVTSIALLALFIWSCSDNYNSGNEILSLTANDSLVEAGGSIQLECTATDEDGDKLGYIWKSASGTLTPDGNKATWVAPFELGIYFISCTVADGYGASDAATIAIEVIPLPGVGVSGRPVPVLPTREEVIKVGRALHVRYDRLRISSRPGRGRV